MTTCCDVTKDSKYYVDHLVVGEKMTKRKDGNQSNPVPNIVCTGKIMSKSCSGMAVYDRDGNQKYVNFVDFPDMPATQMKDMRYNAFKLHRDNVLKNWGDVVVPGVMADSKFDDYQKYVIDTMAPKSVRNLYYVNTKSCRTVCSNSAVTHLDVNTLSFELKAVKTSVTLKTIAPNEKQSENNGDLWIRNKHPHELFNMKVLPYGKNTNVANSPAQWFSTHGTEEWKQFLKKVAERKSSKDPNVLPWCAGIYVSSKILKDLPNANPAIYGLLLLDCLIAQCGEKYFKKADIVDYIKTFKNIEAKSGDELRSSTTQTYKMYQMQGFYAMKSYGTEDLAGIDGSNHYKEALAPENTRNSPHKRGQTRSTSPKVYTAQTNPNSVSSSGLTDEKPPAMPSPEALLSHKSMGRPRGRAMTPKRDNSPMRRM